MVNVVRVLSVRIAETSAGLFLATWQDEARPDGPALSLVETSRADLNKVLPYALEDMFARENEPCFIFPATDHAPAGFQSFAKVPRDLVDCRVAELG